MQTQRFEIVPQPLTVELPEFKTGKQKRNERRAKERKRNKY